MKLGFIGTGKIAAAVIEGFCTANIDALAIYLSPRNEAASKQLAAKYACVTRMETNQQVLDQATIIFIAVRPSIVETVLQELQFRTDHTVVSFVPFLKYAALTNAIAPAATACRAIPLPSIAAHQCPVPIYPPTVAITTLFSHIGQPLEVHDEQQLHTLWTLTGLISPYYDMLLALSNWTVENGVPATTANAYLANMFQALSYMAQHADPIDFKALASHAATPQGMNEQAAKEITASGAHHQYVKAAIHLLERFK
jgi:pyrroline-5-carboxylate reductase